MILCASELGGELVALATTVTSRVEDVMEATHADIA